MSDAVPASSQSAGEAFKKAAWRGSTITLLGQGTSAVIRVGANLVITRLLVPEHFGVMALVNVFLIGLHLFSDIGVGPNIIQSPRGEDPAFLDTAWTVQVIRGAALWICSCLLAWPLAHFYGKPELVLLIPVAGLSALLGGFESTRLFTQNRQLAFFRVTALDLGAQVASVVVMIVSAWFLRSVWALVISGLVSSLLRTILSHTILPGHANRFAWEPEARRSLFAFGRWIFISTAITFLSSQSDRLVLGKLVPVEELGLYAIAANLASMPAQVIYQVTQKVFYPLLASALRSDTHDRASILRSRARLLVLLAPGIALGVAMAPPVVAMLYDPRYVRVGSLTSLLSIGTWLSTVGSSYGIMLLAAGHPRELSFGFALKVALFLGLTFVVAPRWGTAGLALLVALSELGFFLVVFLAVKGRLRLTDLGADVGATALGAAAVGGFLGVHALVLGATGSPIVALSVVTVLGLAATAALARKFRMI